MEKFKYACLELDLDKIDPKKPITWNIYYQFGVDIEDENGPYNYVDFYMPEELQQKFVEEYLKITKVKEYKRYRDTRKAISWEVLSYFPVGSIPNGYDKEI